VTILDWIVVVAYMVGMLAIGGFYARRSTTSEDYLLGGRRIGAISVGLSLFASLLSTLSYLAKPGEVIEHGPMIAAQLLGYPLVYFIVGYGLIPFFMKQPMTSAYEILETRFGLATRLLGSTIFLAIRLAWMGIVIFVTTDKILVPLAKLPPTATPYVCALMGFATVSYTSLGGLRAVVVSDVLQTLILLGGATTTLVVVTLRMGGVAAWWPTEWPEHWDTFQIGIDMEARVTVLAAAIAGLIWWICTAGSDQMAVQRYLATRNPRAARSALRMSLIASTMSFVLLGFVGVALMGYFKMHTDLLPAGASIDSNSDGLFPHFIVLGLPPGVTGLVIAGLLAAAMSSLSSGISSACSVIAVDFFDRLGPTLVNEAQHVRRTKLISWTVGTLAVLLSAAVGFIEGNLLEVSFKAANLLTAPLFMLFFMAFFIPWATWLGAFAAVAASTLAAVWVAYFNLLDLSFIWILPVSFVVGILVGPLVSLIPMPAANSRDY
jgi:SSS family solute:Na+ symporter